MPEFQPDHWNQPMVVTVNNCYTYAVDDCHAPPPGSSVGSPPEPGAQHDITAGLVMGAEPRGAWYTLYLDYTLEGIKTAALADGLEELSSDGRCSPGGWRVAYFVRRFREGPPPVSGSPHFVREDQPGQWSHKPGARPVTRGQYRPRQRDYRGPPITDPSRDPVGPALEFGGYLCCRPHTRVSSLGERERLRGLALAGSDDRAGGHPPADPRGWS